MDKRHKQSKDNNDIKIQPTFSMPDIVAQPKTEKEKKLKKLEVQREVLETNLQGDYLDKIEKVMPYDLGFISEKKLYEDEPKPDRRYNRAVNHTNQELKLITFFMSNLKPFYRHKIKSSDEFKNFMSNILDIKSAGKSDMTEIEKEQSLAIASQMIVFSLEVIIKSMPSEFRVILVDTAKPFTNLLTSLSEYARKNHIKEIPQIIIPDILSTR